MDFMIWTLAIPGLLSVLGIAVIVLVVLLDGDDPYFW